MSGELSAFIKIAEGLKELGKSLIAEDPQAKTTPQADPWAAATNQQPQEKGVYVVSYDQVQALIKAARDPDIWKHVPMGMARPVQNLLDQVARGWDK